MTSSMVLIAGIIVSAGILALSSPEYAAAGSESSVEKKSGVTIYKSEKCYQSYTLYSSRQTEVANLIDMAGNIVHRWSYPQGFTWHYAELLPNGHLGAIIKETEKKVDGMLIELDWEGNLVRRMDVPAHHDFERLSNGNTIVLCREYVVNDAVYPGDVKSDYYVELTPDDEVVWMWHIDEHALKLKKFVDVEFPRKNRDWAHTNTIEVLPDNPLSKDDPRFRAGNVLFSARNVDTIGVIDKETGEVVWAWGPGVLDKQHMPTMLDNGNILIYDNGTARRYTRIVELDPRTEEIVWEYKADPPESFFSPTRGSNQRLPNGNTFIADSDNGRLFEVTPEGEIVWEFLNPDLTKAGKRMPLYRSMRYSPEFVERFIESR